MTVPMTPPGRASSGLISAMAVTSHCESRAGRQFARLSLVLKAAGLPCGGTRRRCAYSSSCGPTASTLPSSRKTILSSRSTVEMRWAISSVVLPARLVFRLSRMMRLGAGIDGRDRVVQNQNRRVFQQCPGDRDALLLPAGNGHAALAQHGLVAVLEVHDVVPHIGQRGGAVNVLPCWRRPRRSQCCGRSCPRTGSYPAARRRRRCAPNGWTRLFTSCPSTNSVPSGTL